MDFKKDLPQIHSVHPLYLPRASRDNSDYNQIQETTFCSSQKHKNVFSINHKTKYIFFGTYSKQFGVKMTQIDDVDSWKKYR